MHWNFKNDSNGDLEVYTQDITVLLKLNKLQDINPMQIKVVQNISPLSLFPHDAWFEQILLIVNMIIKEVFKTQDRMKLSQT